MMKKLKSYHIFKITLVLFIVAMLGELLKIKDLSELLGNILFILLILGTLQLLREKRQE